jgi:Leucine-rich repeat (LRR) protein
MNVTTRTQPLYIDHLNEREEEETSLASLPSELIAHILSFAESPGTTVRVCRLFRDLTEEVVYPTLLRKVQNIVQGDETKTAREKIKAVFEQHKRQLEYLLKSDAITKQVLSLNSKNRLLTDMLNLNCKWIQDINLLIMGSGIDFDNKEICQNMIKDAKEGKGLALIPAAAAQIRKKILEAQFSMKRINLNSKGLTLVPVEIRQLQNLQRIDLPNNSLTSLPAEIGQLQNLLELDLIFNCLTSFPAEIGQLQNLERLDLSSNSLASLPAEIGQLQNLLELDLPFNCLTSLPAEIGQLQNLERLDLSSNSLASLPAEIRQLQNLLELNLPNNCLTSLPAEIGQLQNLQWLSLSNNSLASLPAEVGQLQNLQKLLLYNNNLT